MNHHGNHRRPTHAVAKATDFAADYSATRAQACAQRYDKQGRRAFEACVVPPLRPPRGITEQRCLPWA